jgi:hypothetical protein
MLSADECHFGGGMYMPSKDNLQKIREYIANNRTAFEKLLNDKEFNTVFGGLAKSEMNKILPKEFKSLENPHPFIYNKQFYYMAPYPGEKTALRQDLLPFIASHHYAAKSWDAFFKKLLH